MNDIEAVAESAMCALLREGRVERLASKGAEFQAGLFEGAERHGVGPLLFRELLRSPKLDYQAAECERFRAELAKRAAVELIRKHELIRVLNALAESDVAVLLLKGAALAYSIYTWPVLRPRADTDLLIRHGDREAAERILSKLGYEMPNATSGEHIQYQCGYTLSDRYGIEHVLDLHWRLNNTQIFSRALTWEELQSRSMPVPSLAGQARTLARADSLLLACMHRVHHIHSPYHAGDVSCRGGERLIWLYDIHLLIDAMSPAELEEFARLADEKGMRSICRDGLLNARRCFATSLPEELLVSLSRASRNELSAEHLQKGDVRHLLTELRSLPRWRDRVAMLSEHLFPPCDYMRTKYKASKHVWLPMLYMRRGVHGVWKRIHSF
jgi:hypothetical protein